MPTIQYFQMWSKTPKQWYDNNNKRFTNSIRHMMKRILLLLIFSSFSKLDLKTPLKDLFWQLLLNFDQPRFPSVKTSLVCGFMVFTFTKLHFHSFNSFIMKHMPYNSLRCFFRNKSVYYINYLIQSRLKQINLNNWLKRWLPKKRGIFIC